MRVGATAGLGPASLAASPRRHWAEERERGAVWLLRFMLWLATRVGRIPAALLLYPISAYYMLREPLAREHSREFLKRALPRPPHAIDVFRHFHCFATTILDRVFLLSAATAPLTIDVIDEGGVLQRSRGGQGCLLLGAHLGSFDMLRSLAVGEAALRLKVLMRDAHNPRLTRLLASLNPGIADPVVPWRGPADVLKIKELLDAGYCVAILADRVMPGERSIPCEFLGEVASFPLAPMQLAALLRAPVFFVCGLRRARNRYEARFELLAEAGDLPPARSAEALAPWVQAYVDRLAALAREAPYNWFNFFAFWAR